MSDCQVLVVGAGYVGSRLLASFAPGTALGLRRGASRDSSQRSLQADLDREVPRLPEAATIVYTVPPARGESPDIRLANFLQALHVAPRRIVYVSTSGVYGDCHGRLVDESAPLHAETARARRRVAAEQQLATWCENRRTQLAVLRVPGIYGPGRLRLERLKNGDPVLREQDAGPGNRIHVDDLVACLRAAVDDARPAGVFNVGDGDYRSSTWFALEVAKQARLPPPPELSLAEAREQFSRMRLSFLNESRRLDVRRMRDVLQVTLAYPDPGAGIRASLRDESA